MLSLPRKTTLLLSLVTIFLQCSAQAKSVRTPEETLTIGLAKAVFRRSPGYLSPKAGDWKYGDQVKILEKRQPWVLAVKGGQTGWLHESAFGNNRSILKDIGRGEAVSKETYRDEVVTAGKGFNPEFEKMYREKNKNLNYDFVDRLEQRQVSPAQIEAFIKTGQLNSRLLGGQP